MPFNSDRLVKSMGRKPLSLRKEKQMEYTEDDLYEIWSILIDETSSSEMRAMSFMEFYNAHSDKKYKHHFLIQDRANGSAC
jgi:hypothetical protein